MNYSILLTVKKPDEQNNKLFGQYEKFVRILEDIQMQNKGNRLLQEGTILLPLNTGLNHVADAVKAIRNLPYTYAIVPEDIIWIEVLNKDA